MSKTTCLVKNRGASHVSYRIPEDGIRRSFAPGETKEISYQELEKLTFQPGGMMLLTNYLQLIETEALNAFGIHTEPEYHMSEADVAKQIKTGFDVDAALRHIEEEKADNGQNTILKTTERRVKPDAAPAGRRTAPPQYNIIKKAEEAPATDAE